MRNRDQLGLVAGDTESFRCRVQHCSNVDIHANPLRAGPPMAIDAAVDVVALDTDVVFVRAAITPPFGGPEKPNYRGAGRHCQVCRPGISADVECSTTGQTIEALERQADGACPLAATRADYCFG